MTKNDLDLISRARCIRSNEARIKALIKYADTEEAKVMLEEIAEDAFRIHERIAFECYD